MEQWSSRNPASVTKNPGFSDFPVTSTARALLRYLNIFFTYVYCLKVYICILLQSKVIFFLPNLTNLLLTIGKVPGMIYTSPISMDKLCVIYSN